MVDSAYPPEPRLRFGGTLTPSFEVRGNTNSFIRGVGGCQVLHTRLVGTHSPETRMKDSPPNLQNKIRRVPHLGRRKIPDSILVHRILVHVGRLGFAGSSFRSFVAWILKTVGAYSCRSFCHQAMPGGGLPDPGAAWEPAAPAGSGGDAVEPTSPAGSGGDVVEPMSPAGSEETSPQHPSPAGSSSSSSSSSVSKTSCVHGYILASAARNSRNAGPQERR